MNFSYYCMLVLVVFVAAIKTEDCDEKDLTVKALCQGFQEGFKQDNGKVKYCKKGEYNFPDAPSCKTLYYSAFVTINFNVYKQNKGTVQQRIFIRIVAISLAALLQSNRKMNCCYYCMLVLVVFVAVIKTEDCDEKDLTIKALCQGFQEGFKQDNGKFAKYACACSTAFLKSDVKYCKKGEYNFPDAPSFILSPVQICAAQIWDAQIWAAQI
uniref:Uncharacterized protein n=1 Tax=Strigamia maritima TaxID=126957 RepID=T1IKL9_STRMM